MITTSRWDNNSSFKTWEVERVNYILIIKIQKEKLMLDDNLVGESFKRLRIEPPVL